MENKNLDIVYVDYIDYIKEPGYMSSSQLSSIQSLGRLRRRTKAEIRKEKIMRICQS